LWRGRASNAVQGNLALSISRAEEVESLIRRIYELSEGRIIDVVGMGDQEHRNNEGTVQTDDPGYRRVDVVIQGHRTIPIYY
jgi:flagellar motor protein MotB